MAKYRLYVDEVGGSGIGEKRKPNDRYLSLTGLVFELDYIQDFVFPSVEGMKREYFGHHPDTPVIFHRSELVNKKFPFNTLTDPNTEELFNDQLLGLIRDFDYMALTVVIDKWAHEDRYQGWRFDPYHYCLDILLERFALWLRKRGAVGDVMAESRGGKEDMRLKTEFTKVRENGTDFVSAELMQATLTSRQLKVKTKGANVAGLQLADLLAHPGYKAVFCRREHKRLPDNFGGRIAAIMEDSKYNRSMDGCIDGYGRKWLP